MYAHDLARAGALKLFEGAPVGEGRDCVCRIVAGVLRKRARALHEQVQHIPTLQIPVDGAAARIGPHDGAAAQMRGLVGGDVVGTLAGHLHDLLRAHARDDLAIALVEIGVHLELVLMEIHGDAKEGAAEAIRVGRIEVEIVVAVGVPGRTPGEKRNQQSAIAPSPQPADSDRAIVTAVLSESFKTALNNRPQLKGRLTRTPSISRFDLRDDSLSQPPTPTCVRALAGRHRASSAYPTVRCGAGVH
jgi:hypothetical protein